MCKGFMALKARGKWKLLFGEEKESWAVLSYGTCVLCGCDESCRSPGWYPKNHSALISCVSFCFHAKVFWDNMSVHYQWAIVPQFSVTLKKEKKARSRLSRCWGQGCMCFHMWLFHFCWFIARDVCSEKYYNSSYQRIGNKFSVRPCGALVSSAPNH